MVGAKRQACISKTMHWVGIFLLLGNLTLSIAVNKISHSHGMQMSRKSVRKNPKATCENDCMGRGLCSSDNSGVSKCICEPKYGGNDCSIDTCEALNHCYDNGVCRHGSCVCDIGFEGPACEHSTPCKHNCSEHGVCKRGKCFCNPGYEGKFCEEEKQCPKDCNSRGFCSMGECVCLGGWGGDSCSIPSPAKDCETNCGGKKRGECRSGTCQCYPGYTGKNCEEKKACEGGCSGHGICGLHEDAVCVCEASWTGDNCESEIQCDASHDNISCAGNGICLHGKCWCNPGYTGDACEIKAKCPKDCSNENGYCHLGVCYCHSGYTGDDCSLSTSELRQAVLETHCSNDCSDHGVCTYGLEDNQGDSLKKCQCFEGWSGDDCSKHQKCESLNHCNDHGSCTIDGNCVCDCGYTGESCSEVTIKALATCPADCHGHGECLMGTCYCFPGFKGDTCDAVEECPSQCNQRGECKWGKCFCEPSFSGLSCEIETGCNACNGHGTCCNGNCFCEKGFVGATCAVRSYGAATCPNDCSNHGSCDVFEGTAQCICEVGFVGDDCGIATTPSLVVVSNASIPEEKVSKTKTKTNHEVMSSLDASTLNVTTKESTDSPHSNSSSSPIVARFAAVEAKIKSPNKCLHEKPCNANGLCKNNKCFCFPWYSGDACEEKLAPEISEMGVLSCGLTVDDKNQCNPLLSTCNLNSFQCECLEDVIHPSCASVQPPSGCVTDDSRLAVDAGEASVECPSRCDTRDENNNNFNSVIDNHKSNMDNFHSIYHINNSLFLVIIGGAFIGGFLVHVAFQIIHSNRQRSLAKEILREASMVTSNEYTPYPRTKKGLLDHTAIPLLDSPSPHSSAPAFI